MITLRDANSKIGKTYIWKAVSGKHSSREKSNVNGVRLLHEAINYKVMSTDFHTKIFIKKPRSHQMD